MERTPTEAAVEGVLDLEGERVFLRGTRCLSCAAVYFPRAVSCRNPDCVEKQVEPARIDGRGELYSYTIQRYRPPALFAMEPWAPYALGLVALENGLRVMGMIAGVALEEIRIGMPLRLSIQPLNAAALTHVFVPDGEEGG